MIYLFFFFILASLSLLKKKSKSLAILLYALLFVCAVYSQFGNDINNIRKDYDGGLFTPDTVERSSTFTFLMLFFGDLGFTFTQFRIVLFLVWSSAVLLFVKRFSLYPTLVFACCFLFPILGFSPQVRNGLMAGLIYFGLYFLLRMDRKWGVPLYVLFVGLATLIHSMAFVYLIVLLAFFPIKRKTLLVLSITASIVVYALTLSGLLASLAASRAGAYYSEYFNTAGTGMEMVMLVIFSCCILANLKMTLLCSRIILKNRHSFNKDQLMVAKYVPRINIVMLSTLPLLLFSLTFFRIFQNLFVISAVLAVNAFRVKRPNRWDTLITYLALYAFLTFVYNLSQGEFFSFFNGVAI